MPLKRRTVVEEDLDDEDFDKPRRSSLQVNLSYVSNLTDSGHGSSRRIDESLTDCPNKNIPLTGRRTRKNISSKGSEPPKKRKRNLPKIIEVQSNINNQEQALNDSCSQLRNAILRKTREIFDQGNELAIKTSRVLEEGSKMIKSVEDELSRSVVLEKDTASKSIILEKNTDTRSTIPESEKTPSPLDETEKSKLPTNNKSLKSMILEMSTNTRSTLLERIKESNLILQTSKDPRSTTEKSLASSGSVKNDRSPSVRVALREDQQIIMSGKNSNSDPVRINVMNSPVSRRSNQADELVTPKKSRISDVPNENQTYPKKRLFSDENTPEGSTSENNFLDPNTPLQKSFLEPSKPLSNFASPVLSGSTRKRLRLSLRKTQIQKENENGQRNKDLSSVKESLNITDRSSSPGLPLTCSSFIDNRNQSRNLDIENFSRKKINESTCMEITTIPNILPISVRGLSGNKENSEKNLKESFKGSQDKRVLSMELTEVEGNILDAIPSQGVNPQLVEAPSDILEDTEILDESVRTTRSSLNVNTSMDPTDGKKNGEAGNIEFLVVF